MAFKCVDLTGANIQIRSEFPGVSHHNSKVLVSIDRARNVSIVVAELIERHDAVSYLGVPHRHELLIGLLGGQFPVDNIGVLAHIVDSSNIIKSHRSVFVNIKFVIGLSDIADTGRTQVTSQYTEEFIKRNRPTVITIKSSKEGLGLVLVNVNAEILKPIHQLSHINLSVSIIINDSEHTSKSTNCHRSTAQQRSLDVSHDSISIVLFSLNYSVSGGIL